MNGHYDDRKIKMDLPKGPVNCYFTSDWHLGNPAHSELGMETFIKAYNEDPTPTKPLFVLGDLFEGHPYGHKYRHAMVDSGARGEGNKNPDFSDQFVASVEVLRRLKYDPAYTVLCLGNHESTAYRLIGDAYASILRLVLGDQMPQYAGFEASVTMRWPDRATFKWMMNHGGGWPPAGWSSGNWWDDELRQVRATRTYVGKLISLDGPYPLHDGYAAGHHHRVKRYLPSQTKKGLRSAWGDPVWGLCSGSMFESGACAWGDYQRQSLYRPYDVGWVEVPYRLGGTHFVSEGGRARRVRTPDDVILRQIAYG